MGDSERFIQGYWYRGNVHFMDQWYFDRGVFSHEAGDFDGNHRTYSGRYQLVEVNEDSVTLELDDTNLSYGDERPLFVIKIDRESDTIRIRGENYERVLP
jgi:hypothetical protein